jgi:ubiquinone/menaquinone biosynthesis C-methylase UbiE
MEVIKNAWEIKSDEHELLALAGHSTKESYIENRKQRAKELISLCGLEQKKRGFEIGSGDGMVVKILSHRCLSINCTDISHSFLEKAQNTCRGLKNISFHLIENNYLNFLESNTYDFGFSLNVFIHFNCYDIVNYLKDVKRILKPGGLFYFDACTIGEATLDLFYEHSNLYRDDPTAIRGLLNFNHPEIIKSLIKQVGFSLSAKSFLDERGWLKVLVIKP